MTAGSGSDGTDRPPGRGRSVEAARRRARLAEVADQLDRAAAQRTLPGPVDEHGVDQRAVDFETWLLHVRYARTRAPAVLDLLVREYEQYALSLARRLRRDGEVAEDLQQVALESLVSALRRFDHERRIPFPAFATPTIAGGLKRHYRDQGWSLRVPRRVHELSGPIRVASEHLTTALGRPPSPSEVAHHLGVTGREVVDAQLADLARSTVSLDVAGAADAAPALLLVELDRSLSSAEDHIALEQAIGQLTPLEQDVVRSYFYDERSQREIAARHGVSQMQVSRWLARIVGRLRERLTHG